jgi:hypothetical protein
LEVAEIARGDAVAEFQSCYSDQQIGAWKAYAFGLIFTVDRPNAKCDRHRDRMMGRAVSSSWMNCCRFPLRGAVSARAAP